MGLVTFYVKLDDQPELFVLERPSHFRGWPVHNTAFVCPFCLRIWGKIFQKGVETASHIQAASCSNHPPSGFIINPFPGSLLDNPSFAGAFDQDLLDSMPLNLVKREYLLHSLQYERYLSHEPPNTSCNEFGAYTYEQFESISAAWCKST